MLKVAVFDSRPYDRDHLEAAGRAEGITWQFHDFRLKPDAALVATGCRAVTVFVHDHVDEPTLEKLRDLGVGLVALRCAGFNNVDLAAARRFGIRVVRVPAYSPHAVAEFAVGLLLTLTRKIHRAYTRVRDHNFLLHGLVGLELFGKQVGVIGTGHIGRVAAEILQGFKMRVVACDPYPNLEWARTRGIDYLPLAELLASSDIVSLHLPLTPESHHLLNRDRLALMKPGAIVINTSRGKLIDSKSLIEALKSGRLGGVGLDVYEEEEKVFSKDLSSMVVDDSELSLLLTFPNVLVTAHQAYLTQEALSEIANVTVGNIARFSRGEELLEGTVLA